MGATAPAPNLHRITAELVVWDIHCPDCAETLEDTIATLPGVDHVSLDLTTGRMQITFRTGEAKLEDFVGAITGAGFYVVVGSVVSR